MIKINGNEQNNKKSIITYGKYNVTQDGKRKEGISPFISFICDNIYVGIETVYDKSWLKEMSKNNLTDITKYISDIIYEDGKGWLSLISGNYIGTLEKIEDKIFNIAINCRFEDCNEVFEICINENINMND